jgi:hypothetical protein
MDMPEVGADSSLRIHPVANSRREKPAQLSGNKCRRCILIVIFGPGFVQFLSFQFTLFRLRTEFLTATRPHSEIGATP